MSIKALLLLAAFAFELACKPLAAQDDYGPFTPLLKDFPASADSPFYGTEHRFYLEIPGRFVPYLSEGCTGTYEGIGEFGGDRRFGPYRRHYKLVVHDPGVADRHDMMTTRPIRVEWNSFTTVADAKVKRGINNNATDDGSANDDIDYQVSDSFFDDIYLWGNMTYHNTSGASVVSMPFLAAKGYERDDKEEHIEGLLLIGRYEGPVFLKKSP